MTIWAPFPGRAVGDDGTPQVTGVANENTGDNTGTFVNTFNDGRGGTSYSISVPTSNIIQASDFNTLLAYVNAERQRRYSSAVGGSFSGVINDADVNWLISLLNTAGEQPNNGYISDANVLYTWPFSGYVGSNVAAEGSTITSTHLANIISQINSAAAVCTCNCNYCTCNCNYCTCNCNYACTCNCNYSDKRLKMNIELVRVEAGLNVYSFSYLWDRTKTYIGVMAQELLGTKYADAVSTDKQGFYVVDYSMLPVKMEG